ncbi:hypothetical protein GPJ56_000067 [Histomonas meleagridis]|uniref:uncharacterized protein n=1 Tax=Histomonas meleagridis TaxID=135588 RepID=UPI00355A0B73|nr:hypothetical protein GPJ56_000067 [Histomonas meleagridis]KAH0805565.1 hypothetical protein GO595_001620 [Histomonas meleagridis]
MKFWDRVFVFTDFVKDEEITMINQEAYPCNVTIIQLGDLAEHLDGTEWTNRWYHAQPRFLPAMASLYEHNQDHQWFLFGDDDTYIFRPGIERKASTFDYNNLIASGKIWSSWNHITKDIPPYSTDRLFMQGGAGVLLSHELMKQLTPQLRNCSFGFNDPDFAGSMRFSVCAERFFGQKKWSASDEGILRNWDKGFHSSPPDEEIQSKLIVEPVGTFHRIQPKMFNSLFQAHAAFYTNAKGEKYIYDLGIFAFQKYKIMLGRIGNEFEWRFGYWIGVEDALRGFIMAESNWEAVVENGILVGFKQKYTGKVTVHLRCDESVPDNKTFFSHFNDDMGSEPVMIASCKEIPVVTISK